MGDTENFIEYGEGSACVTLSRPLKTSDRGEVVALLLREPTVADQLASQESKLSPVAAELSLFANLCELSPEDLKRLPLRDYIRLQTAFAGFLS